MASVVDIADEIEDAIKKEAEIEALRSRIVKARQDYYNDQPSLTDDEYEVLSDQLLALKADHPAVVAIGAPVPDDSPWIKVHHHILMGSLDKVNSMEAMSSWVNDRSGKDVKGNYVRDQLFVTEKLDGFSINVSYEKGKLKQAATRGDGQMGEDITRNVARMKGLPSKITGEGKSFTGSLRGEVVILKTDFDTYFKGDDYRNTRNAAAGVARRFDGKGSENLTVYFYQVADGQDFKTEAEAFEWMTALGLNVPNWYVTMMTHGVRTPQDIWIEYQQSKRVLLDYDIDGLVVRFNDLAKQIGLGEKDGRPNGAIAFKFANVNRETPARGVLEQTGPMGRITPVAVFDPVNLFGATVTNASLYNWRYIREIGFDIGAMIVVTRANDVIPRVVSVSRKTGTTYPSPTKCTSCGAVPVEEGEYWVCPNVAGCPAQTGGRIRRYVQGIGVLEIGEGLIDKLVAVKLVTKVADLYRLTEEQVAGIDRMGKKSAQNVIKSLWSVNPIPLETLLGSLSIPGCAESTVMMVMNAKLDSLEAMRSADKSVFERVPGLGPVKSMAFWTWLQTNGALVDDILSTGLKLKSRIKGGFTGKSFCFTGTMPSGRKRVDLETLVKDKGGTIKKSVTKGLTYLVTADLSSASSKAQAARENGTECITEEGFDNLLASL